MIPWITKAILQVVIIHSSLKNSNIIYLMKILNSKDGVLNYYFHWIKDLIKKTCNLRYIKTFVHQILPKSTPWYQCDHTILSLNSLFIKNIIWKCIEFVLIDYELFQVFWSCTFCVFDFSLCVFVLLLLFHVLDLI
jgi:hypothetical protein